MNKDIVSFKNNKSNFICSICASICINNRRNIISLGKNSKGRLGCKEIDEIIKTPSQISNLMNIKMVGCGRYNTVCLDFDGNVFTFGDNEYGQFGVGKDVDTLPFTHIPQQIVNIPQIDSISCGGYHIVCVTNDGSIYSFGCNNYGQLGIGNYESCLSPQLIPDLSDIEFVVCGDGHTICKTYSNEYYSWGYNRYGQLGQENNDNCNKPHKCLNWPEGIIDIKCGYFHSLLLTSTGYVYSFGRNYFRMNKYLTIGGQLGLNDKKSQSIESPTLIRYIPLIKRIECGYYHSMCIDINDKLWVFGFNKYGQLGLGDNKNRYKPTLNESLHEIIDISSGGNHTLVKTSNNEIYAFGNNEYSQLGIETKNNYQLTPIQLFKDNEDIWATDVRNRQKSARK